MDPLTLLVYLFQLLLVPVLLLQILVRDPLGHAEVWPEGAFVLRFLDLLLLCKPGVILALLSTSLGYLVQIDEHVSAAVGWSIPGGHGLRFGYSPGALYLWLAFPRPFMRLGPACTRDRGHEMRVDLWAERAELQLLLLELFGLLLQLLLELLASVDQEVFISQPCSL